MRALIVEDDIIQLDGTAAIITARFHDIECLKASDYEEAVHIIENYDIHFFILDIQLGSSDCRDGIELGKFIRSFEKHHTTPILYITALPELAPHAIHNTNCFDYIVKPYTPDDLLSSIQKLLNLSLIEDSPVEIIDRNGVYARLKPDQIFCIRSELRNMHIYTNIGTYVTSSTRLSYFSQILPCYFVRCHKSYIINSHYIVSFDKTTSIISLGTGEIRSIPVGRKYFSEIASILSSPE